MVSSGEIFSQLSQQELEVEAIHSVTTSSFNSTKF